MISAVPSLNKIVGINLRYYRYLENLSQEKFYSKYKLSIKHLSNVETGNANVTLKEIEKIGKAIGVDPQILVIYDESKIINKKRVDQKVTK